jgi:sensor histidine kinase YesM
MNPHFSHNVLNSIGALIFSSQPQEVYKQLTRFSKMLRGLLQDEGSFIIPLEQELDFVANYLELEKLRFEDRFEYLLPVLDEAVKQIPIPKLLIQIPVENAIKHGLSSTSGIGHLKISICTKDHETQISIEDDGIGVAESKRRGQRGTGRGFEIMDSLTRFANQEKLNNYSYEVEDFKESSSDKSGTIVRIVIGTN